MTNKQMPEALRLAEMLLSGVAMIPEIDLPEAASELRRQHARIEALEAAEQQHLQELRSYRITVDNREARIVELEKKLGAARHALPAAVPDNWRDQFSESVYEDLSAADNQDVPLEEYPARILNILDAIVGPRHPTVIKWRNDAIRSCIAIAYKYCSDTESHRYLKQDLEAMLAAPAHPAEGAPAQAVHAAWLHVECADSDYSGFYEWQDREDAYSRAATHNGVVTNLYTHPTPQGLDAQQLHNDIMNLPAQSAVGIPNSLDHAYALGHRDALAAAELRRQHAEIERLRNALKVARMSSGYHMMHPATQAIIDAALQSTKGQP